MKFWLTGLLLMLTLIACPGVDKPSPPEPPTPPPNTTPTPIVTPPGTPDGFPSSGRFDAAGGRIKTEGEYGATLEVLPNTVTNANITLQPISNPLGLSGKGVSITSDVAWSRYAKITFPIEPSDDSPEGLGIAVRQTDGSWLSLEPIKVDVKAGTVSAGLPATVGTAGLRPQAGLNLLSVVKFKKFYLKPSSATVKVGQKRSFVPYAQVVVNETDPSSKPIDPDEEIVPLAKFRKVTREYAFTNNKTGFLRDWTILGAGNSNVGTISPTGTVGAIYTAPGTKPNPDTVTVRFGSTNINTLDTIILDARVKITDTSEGSIRVRINGSKTVTYGSRGQERTSVDLTYDLNLKTAPPITPIFGGGYVGTYEFTPQVSGTVTHNGQFNDAGDCDVCDPSKGKFTKNNRYDGSTTLLSPSGGTNNILNAFLGIEPGQISAELVLPGLLPFAENGQGSGVINVTGCNNNINKTLNEAPRLQGIRIPSRLSITVADPSKPNRLTGSVTIVNKSVEVSAPESRSSGARTTWNVPVTITIEYDLPYNPLASLQNASKPASGLEIGDLARQATGNTLSLESRSDSASVMASVLPFDAVVPDANLARNPAQNLQPGVRFERHSNPSTHGATLELGRPGLGSVERCGQAPPTQ